MANLPSLLELFARRQGMEMLIADELGRYCLIVDSDMSVECFERFKLLHLLTPLADPPVSGAQRRAWFTCLMNFALKRMKGNRSTPALLGSGSMVLFARYGIARMSVEEFEAAVEELVNSLENYRHLLGASESMQPAPRLTRSIVRP